MPENVHTLHFESLSIHAGENVHNVQQGTGSLNPPVYASTSFTFNNSEHGADIFAGKNEDYAYSRLGNPTLSVFEQRITALEGGVAALPASSGEAARWMAIAGLVAAGENFVAAATVSEDAYTQFKFRFSAIGVGVKFVDVNDLGALRKAIDMKTRAVYCESISSVGLEVADIQGIASVVSEAEIPLVVDNTPGIAGYLIRPIEHGAHIIISSTSEWITGSGNAISGVIIDSGKFSWKRAASKFPHLTTPSPGYHGLNFVEKFGDTLAYILYLRMAILRDVGPCLNPFAATFAIAGLASLSPRVDRHNSNALALALWLERESINNYNNKTNEGKIGKVIFPGLTSHRAFGRNEKYLRLKEGYGAVMHFTLKGGAEAEEAFAMRLKLIKRSDGLGTAQTLIYIPDDGLAVRPEIKDMGDANIRLSVGLEHVDDIIADIKQALEHV